MRARVCGVTALIVVAAIAGSVHARRVVRLTPKCPPNAKDLMIDYDGAKDVCAGTAEIVCQPGRQPVTDRKGEEDRCATADGKAESKPACPRGFEWKARVGADECVAAMQPICLKGFELKVRPGEDACVY